MEKEYNPSDDLSCGHGNIQTNSTNTEVYREAQLPYKHEIIVNTSLRTDRRARSEEDMFCHGSAIKRPRLENKGLATSPNVTTSYENSQSASKLPNADMNRELATLISRISEQGRETNLRENHVEDENRRLFLVLCEWEKVQNRLESFNLVRKHIQLNQASGLNEMSIKPKAILNAFIEYEENVKQLEQALNDGQNEIKEKKLEISSLKENELTQVDFRKKIQDNMEESQENFKKLAQLTEMLQKRQDETDKEICALKKELDQAKLKGVLANGKSFEPQKTYTASQANKTTPKQHISGQVHSLFEAQKRISALQEDKHSLEQSISLERAAKDDAQAQIDNLKRDFAISYGIENQVSDSEIKYLIGELEQGISDLAHDIGNRFELKISMSTLGLAVLAHPQTPSTLPEDNSDFGILILQSIIWETFEELFTLVNSCGNSEEGIIGTTRALLKSLNLEEKNIDTTTKEWMRKMRKHLKFHHEHQWTRAKARLGTQVQNSIRSKFSKIGIAGFEKGELKLLECMIKKASELAETLHKQQLPYIFNRDPISGHSFEPEHMELIQSLKITHPIKRQSVSCIVVPLLAKLKEENGSKNWTIVQKAKVLCESEKTLEASGVKTHGA